MLEIFQRFISNLGGGGVTWSEVSNLGTDRLYFSEVTFWPMQNGRSYLSLGKLPEESFHLFFSPLIPELSFASCADILVFLFTRRSRS